ncbi:MAG: molybdenum cofactor guanylyltransferase [Gammaproteobacteria bacterium]|nr:molybdenum cofactor guanylyltransferase [Gammaproteobacteria bacterium]MYJ76362.1 molybdenum cofactor guanylyltransferase [Gammaproteobacteria bacterium]
MSRRSASSDSTATPGITALILCGGRATRLGGIEKPLADLGGKSLLAHVIARLEPQVDSIVLSVGRGSAQYAGFGYPVVVDDDPDQGPLAGIVSALAVVDTPWTLTTPADTPFLPSDLVHALAPSCRDHGAAVVSAGGHRQNLAMLLDRTQAASLAEFYAAGGRAVHRWLVASGVDEVAFPEDGFMNINTPDDLAHARLELDRRSPL